MDNPDAVLSYFESAREWLRDKRQVNFDLSTVKRVTPDAIALMVANVQSRRFRNGMNVMGKAPRDAVASRMFDESGFYDHVQSKRLVESAGTSDSE